MLLSKHMKVVLMHIGGNSTNVPRRPEAIKKPSSEVLQLLRAHSEQQDARRRSGKRTVIRALAVMLQLPALSDDVNPSLTKVELQHRTTSAFKGH